MAKYNYRQSDAAPVASLPSGNWWDDRPQMPYIVPFFAYILVMAPASLSHSLEEAWKTYLPVVYTVKTLLAAALLWYFWPAYTRIRWSRIPWGIVAGIVGTFAWIYTEYACQKIGISIPPKPSDVYNPDQMLGAAASWQKLTFLCIRIAGPSLVVPFMEELFFRDFVMRLLVRGERFQDIAVGTFTWTSLIGMSLLFGINHGLTRMFVAGVVYGLLMGILVIRTKSLGACIVAHGVTNFTLYLYVLYWGDWQFM